MRIKRSAKRTFFNLSLCLALVAGSRTGLAYEAMLAEPMEGTNLSGPKPSTGASFVNDSRFDHLGCNGQCDECAPQIGCCLLCPCDYFWAEGLLLTRDNQSRHRPLVLDLNNNDVLLKTNDLDFNWDGGLRLGYCCNCSDCWSVEFGYLGVFNQTASDGVELASSLMLPGDLGLQVNDFFGADDVDVRYTSDLHSFEANLVCCCCDCGCNAHSIETLCGFRYINFEEDFHLTSEDLAEGTTKYNVGTDNNLFGAQAGARYRACHGRWSWETTGKAGIYANDMEQSQAPIVDFPGFVFRTRRSSDNVDVAFVGDVNLTFIWQLDEVWGLRAGYNAIWLENVALAPDQLAFANNPNSGKRLVDDGGVFLHGVNLGVEARW
jgi:hypothetical protein